MQIYFPLLLILIQLFMASCDHKDNSSANTAIEQSSRLPGTVKQLVSYVGINNPDSFANLIAYPLQRPYPLHDINDAIEMRKYYHTIVDDSLRNVIARSTPNQWNEYGWRGWTVRDGEYVWLDSLVYDIPYISQAELADLDKLRSKEISSLDKSLQGSWLPVITLISDSGSVIRIDARQNADPASAEALRLLAFGKDSDLRGMPTMTMTGHLETEGSALYPLYMFRDKDGNDAIIDMQPADSPEPRLTYRSTDGNISEQDLHRGYWLDLLEK